MAAASGSVSGHERDPDLGETIAVDGGFLAAGLDQTYALVAANVFALSMNYCPLSQWRNLQET
jgi:hypothetical protein